MEIKEKYLPIGTVVMLKGGSKRVMIAGFYVEDEEDSQVYDYSGCTYPEGFLAMDQVCLFNHNQIEKIYHMGLEDDEEEKEFKKELKQIVEEEKS